MDRLQHEAWNEAMARRYNPDAFIMRSGFIVRRIEAMRLERTRQALGCQPTDRVLDLGCGPGNLLERLEGERIVGLDLSDTMIAQARERVRGRRGFEVMKGNAESLPFPEAFFHRVACSEVLEHVLDPWAVLQEIHRVAKPDARVVVTLPNERLINLTKRAVLLLGLKRWIAGGYDMSDDMLDEWHRSEITLGWMRRVCRGRFRIVEHRSVPFIGIAYHRILAFDVVK
jgi:ubiquinone/menaquinone biosynthesis C-methylase UbiE